MTIQNNEKEIIKNLFHSLEAARITLDLYISKDKRLSDEYKNYDMSAWSTMKSELLNDIQKEMDRMNKIKAQLSEMGVY